MYWFKHGRDVCIGSNMREMYVLVQNGAGSYVLPIFRMCII